MAIRQLVAAFMILGQRRSIKRGAPGALEHLFLHPSTLFFNIPTQLYDIHFRRASTFQHPYSTSTILLILFSSSNDGAETYDHHSIPNDHEDKRCQQRLHGLLSSSAALMYLNSNEDGAAYQNDFVGM